MLLLSCYIFLQTWILLDLIPNLFDSNHSIQYLNCFVYRLWTISLHKELFMLKLPYYLRLSSSKAIVSSFILIKNSDHSLLNLCHSEHETLSSALLSKVDINFVAIPMSTAGFREFFHAPGFYSVNFTHHWILRLKYNVQ